MNFKRTDVWGFKHALRGMRNPMNSWDKSDSLFSNTIDIGANDLDLATRLIKAGTEHRKFLRQIMVSVDITAPLYWWKEFDTYKVGTTANSTSTMHKLATTPITMDCFELDDYENIEFDGGEIETIINYCERLRLEYLKTNDKRYWKELIRWLPESWLQTRTVTMNYENLLNMYHQRKNHKLTEWHTFCEWVITLPHSNIITEVS